jgi:hypothetical protein
MLRSGNDLGATRTSSSETTHERGAQIGTGRVKQGCRDCDVA